MNSVESSRGEWRGVGGAAGRISSIYPTVLPKQKQSCMATDSPPMITMISTDTDHMNDVGTLYSHRVPRRARVILSKGSFIQSFIHTFTQIFIQYSTEGKARC